MSQSATTMVGNAWSQPGFPRRGWVCVDVVDLNPDRLPEHLVDYSTCEACGRYPIRFVHTLEHEDWPDRLDVGCICAGHLTGDYDSQRLREEVLKKRSTARVRWLAKRWRISAKGAYWLKEKGHHVAVFRSRFHDGWRCSFDGKFGELVHPTREAAMLSVFNKFTAVLERQARTATVGGESWSR